MDQYGSQISIWKSMQCTFCQLQINAWLSNQTCCLWIWVLIVGHSLMKDKIGGDKGRSESVSWQPENEIGRDKQGSAVRPTCNTKRHQICSSSMEGGIIVLVCRILGSHTMWKGGGPRGSKFRSVQLSVTNTAFPTCTESFGRFQGKVNRPILFLSFLDPTDSLGLADMTVCRRIDDSLAWALLQWVL